MNWELVGGPKQKPGKPLPVTEGRKGFTQWQTEQRLLFKVRFPLTRHVLGQESCQTMLISETKDHCGLDII